MKKVLLASVSIAALFMVSEAGAADLAVKAPRPMVIPAPIYSWTGCYVGAHVGWGKSSNHHTMTSFSGGSGGGTTASGRVSSSGALFGGRVGCNYQFAGNWVLGVQGDIAGTDFNGMASDAWAQKFRDSDTTTFVGVKTDWLASVTGRLGYSFYDNQAMFYVKGGGAWVHNIYNLHDTFLDFGTPVAGETKAGATVGAGFEWRFAQNWTAFVEGNYYQFNHTKAVAIDCCTQTFYSNKQTIETVKIGVNYLFTMGPSPVVARY